MPQFLIDTLSLTFPPKLWHSIVCLNCNLLSQGLSFVCLLYNAFEECLLRFHSDFGKTKTKSALPSLELETRIPHWEYGLPVSRLPLSWGQVNMPQRFPTILKLPFLSFRVHSGAVGLWVIIGVQTKLVLTVCLIFLSLCGGTNCSHLPSVPFFLTSLCIAGCLLYIFSSQHLVTLLKFTLVLSLQNTMHINLSL